ncbi:3-hydroxyacyl-CoA dehydrogenase NAD-binding domain-containing protein [Oceanicella actignis]|uniref:3-hydroxyacyl-CoA dehydrogenase NAD-binding domain-containing protein n=1 Tax=Oceanicella actignis TaxID=1189325 RepID=UPI00125B163B|nr:3-hydroxyacyl-CoA dehydrogenase NAD-binding domain-containing protein [Oceanicella actignis]TYO89611.1 3-hydroxyacyl-CoA dehydrogenase/enoyl-CoA hydratase/3-hydroxybutyryl-CoA epimerase [Oceanicella actignis]
MPFHYEKDADGVVVVTMDMDGQSANTMNAQFRELMAQTMDRLEAEQGLTGVVIASAKKTFFAGGDLNALLAVETADETYFRYVEENKAFLRRLERLAVPVVAAINGAALGGGYEIALACNRRICVDDPAAVTGVPEVTLGLLPGAGGVVRITALLGLEKALPVLLEGKPHAPARALELGMIDQIVPDRESLIPAAKAWIRANPDAHVQPWDRKGFRYPGGDADAPNVRMTATVAPTLLIRKTRGLSPAPERILDLAVNSMRMGFDSALRAESRAFCKLVVSREAKAAISTFFFGMNALKSGRFRPEGPRWRARSAAVIGAGMMGAGIAYAHAERGLETALRDVSDEAARAGKARAGAIAEARAKKGRLSAAEAEALTARIRPTAQDDFAGADVIVEAVFEDLALKEKVIADTFPLLSEEGIYGTNTSTLPVSILAEACPDPARFIGIHFFSPVEKMQLVELIAGEKTSAETIRKAWDYVRQIGRIPIVVNDSRGFFTSRVFGTYLDEGMALLRDGMAPAAIERAAWKIGMPVGPLQVHDEVSLELTMKVHATHKALDARLGVENGFPADNAATLAVAGPMVEMGRLGRKAGAGFYDYGPEGRRLWPGLAQFAQGPGASMRDAEDRLLWRQAIEALRCLDEGVLRSQVEGDIGSIMAIGFPHHTGGALRFIRGMGPEAFKARADQLADAWGERFRLSERALARLRDDGRAAA